MKQSWTAGNKNFQRMHDTILGYTKSNNFKFNVQFEPYGDWIKKDYSHVDEEGRRWRWHTVKGKRYKVYLEDENKDVKLNDVWQIPYLGSTAKERLGYPTQKPRAPYERMIKASSNEGDLVMDPFAGCGTTIDSEVSACRGGVSLLRGDRNRSDEETRSREWKRKNQSCFLRAGSRQLLFSFACWR